MSKQRIDTYNITRKYRLCLLVTTWAMLWANLLFADPSNPQANRGNFVVMSSEYGETATPKKYPVSNAIDENPLTAWVFEKKATTFQKFIGLFIEFKSAMEVDGISLINGYAKSDSLYKFNNAVKTFEIILPNHQVYTFSCAQTLNFQDFNFPLQKVKWMIIKVKSIRKGSKYDDLCISEISPLFKQEKLMYTQPKFIIGNNGAEYESDILMNLVSQKRFDAATFDFACGAKNPVQVNDSILVYGDDCEDSSLNIKVFNFSKMSSRTVTSAQFNNCHLVGALSENLFILTDSKTMQTYQFNALTQKQIQVKHHVPEKTDYWRWSERLAGDLSSLYKKIE